MDGVVFPPHSTEASGTRAFVGEVVEGDVDVGFNSGQLSPRSTVALERADDVERASDAGFVSAYVEVKNELWVEKDPLLGAALRQWEKKLAYFDNSLFRRQKKATQIWNQIYNLVVVFFIFQGILLVVVSLLKASNGAHCGLVWSPLALSVFTTWGTVSGVSSKFFRLRALEFTTELEEQSAKTLKYRIQALQAQGKEFRFFKDAKDPKLSETRSFAKSWSFALATLLAVTAIFIISYFVILCESFMKN